MVGALGLEATSADRSVLDCHGRNATGPCNE
jgi:hypothetical protein